MSAAPATRSCVPVLSITTYYPTTYWIVPFFSLYLPPHSPSCSSLSPVGSLEYWSFAWCVGADHDTFCCFPLCRSDAGPYNIVPFIHAIVSFGFLLFLLGSRAHHFCSQKCHVISAGGEHTSYGSANVLLDHAFSCVSFSSSATSFGACLALWAQPRRLHSPVYLSESSFGYGCLVLMQKYLRCPHVSGSLVLFGASALSPSGWLLSQPIWPRGLESTRGIQEECE